MIRSFLLLLLTASTLNASFELPAPPPDTRQSGPKIASDGVDFTAVWSELTGSAETLVAQRISASGDRLGPRLELFPVAAFLRGHDVAFGGGVPPSSGFKRIACMHSE